MLGLIAGGPTFLGTIIGQQVSSPLMTVAFLALAAGSILYVVIELLAVARARSATVAGAWVSRVSALDSASLSSPVTGRCRSLRASSPTLSRTACAASSRSFSEGIPAGYLIRFPSIVFGSYRHEHVACLTNRFPRALPARSIEGCQEGLPTGLVGGGRITWDFTM